MTSLGMVGLLLGAAHAAQLTATWIDNSDNEKDFKLERKTGTTGNYQLLASVPADTTFYVDTTVTAGTTYCYRVRAKNDAGESANSNEACAVAANPVLQSLTVAKAGTGAGTVASSPSGITCGATCSASFTSGTTVGLSATAATGSTFTGWSGACTGTGGCAVVLDAAKSVTATFAAGAATTYTLTVAKAGAGTGTVTSSPTGINCGATCSASYTNGANITLTAAAATGSTFTGWSGACSGTGTCTTTMSQARTVTATFAAGAANSPLTVSSVTANRASPQPAGTSLTATATVTGGVAPYQYKWWVSNGSTWTVVRDWGTGNTLTWTPPAPGDYEIQAWVRNSGVTADTWQAWGRLLHTATGSGLTVSRVTANRTGTQRVGQSLTATATATGGVAPYQYKWWVSNGSTWTVVRDWSTGNTLAFTPRARGDYLLQVWVRSAGTSGEPPEAYGNLPIAVR